MSRRVIESSSWCTPAFSLIHNNDPDADVDADTGIEMNPILVSVSRSRSNNAACVKSVSLMLPAFTRAVYNRGVDTILKLGGLNQEA